MRDSYSYSGCYIWVQNKLGSLQRRGTPRCFMHGIIVERVSCLVHGLHGVWCVFQGWDVGTLGNILSGYITQYPRVGDGLVLSTLLTLFAWLRSCSVFTAVWCGISFVKTQLLPSPDPILAMGLWLVWTNSPNFTHKSINSW